MLKVVSEPALYLIVKLIEQALFNNKSKVIINIRLGILVINQMFDGRHRFVQFMFQIIIAHRIRAIVAHNQVSFGSC